MKHLTKIIIAAVIVLVGISAVFSTTPTFAASNVCKEKVAEDVKKAAGCNDASTSQLPNTISNILTAIIGACGLVAVVFVLIGGINYMTANGDAGKLKTAKNTILYALIGLIICALAFAIVNWTIGSVLKQGAANQTTNSKTK